MTTGSAPDRALEVDDSATLEATIRTMFAPGADGLRRPVQGLANPEDAARHLIERHYTRVGVREPEAAVAALPAAIAPAFVAELRQNNGRFVDLLIAGDPAVSPAIPEAASSTRMKSVVYGVEKGRKFFICPFTGQVESTEICIGIEAYYRAFGGEYCLILESDNMFTPTSTPIYVFPEHRLVIHATTLEDPSLCSYVAHFFAQCFGCRDLVPAAISDAPSGRAIAVSDFVNPHFGHQLLNVLSGWEVFLQSEAAQKVDHLMAFRDNDLFGHVFDLYGDRLPARAIRLAPESELEAARYILSNRLLCFFVKHDFIRESLCNRIVEQSRRSLEPARLAAIDGLRRAAAPLVMISLRLDNRMWLTQREGLVGLMDFLAARFPGIAFVVDGLNRSRQIKASTHAYMSLDDEAALARVLCGKVDDDVAVYDSIGCSIAESIVLCDRIDFFVAPVGSGMAKFKWVTNKPGVAYSNRKCIDPRQRLLRFDSDRENILRATVVPADWIVDDDGPARENSEYRRNFDMDWRRLAGLVEAELARFGFAPENGPGRKAVAPAARFLAVARLDALAGRLEDAAGSYRKAVARAPSMAEAHAGLGSVLRRLGRPAQAADGLRRAAALAPESPAILVALADALRDLERFEEARTAYEAALGLTGVEPDAALGLAAALLGLDRPEEALAACDRALALGAGASAVETLQGEARRAGRQALARRIEAEAEAAEALGDLAAALQSRRALFEQAPDHPAATERLVGILRRSGRLEEAEALTRSALAAGPPKAGLLVEQGWNAHARRDWQAAEASFGAALRLDRLDAAGWHGLALALAEQGRLAEADQLYQTALGLIPGHPALLHGHAMIAARQGDWFETVRRCEAGLAIRPDDPTLRAEHRRAAQTLEQYLRPLDAARDPAVHLQASRYF
jgi:tetratricopeptide (TPR) repeat protein